jgi:hypothetical protein
MRKRARISLGGSEQVYGRFCRIRSWFERGRQECSDYAAEVETVLETFAPADPRTRSGTSGRQLPGTAASFKLCSKTAEGRERGCNPVTVTRPTL